MSDESTKMPPEQWEEFKKHRDAFKEAFKGEDEDDLNCALQELPDNIRAKDDYNSMSYITNWDGCPLHDIASYYAHGQVGNDPGVAIVGSIEEMRKLLMKHQGL
jgi:hypothetical protein